MTDSSLKTQAYTQIKAKIITLEYSPNSVISEASLLKDLDMSRTPVRESLIKLEQENFIKILPKKGILINPLTLSDVNMIFDTRLLIEPFLLNKYSNYINLTELASLLEQLKQEPQKDPQSNDQLDDKLHKLICLCGPNSFLKNTLEHVYDQHNRIRVLCAPNVAKRYSQATHEHILLCDAVLSGDITLAVRLLTEHLNTSKEIAIAALLDSKLSI